MVGLRLNDLYKSENVVCSVMKTEDINHATQENVSSRKNEWMAFRLCSKHLPSLKTEEEKEVRPESRSNIEIK